MAPFESKLCASCQEMAWYNYGATVSVLGVIEVVGGGGEMREKGSTIVGCVTNG